jgi:hypothetical protein
VHRAAGALLVAGDQLGAGVEAGLSADGGEGGEQRVAGIVGAGPGDGQVAEVGERASSQSKTDTTRPGASSETITLPSR